MSTIQRIRKGAQALDDLADAIRNPENQGAVGNAIGQAGRRFCDAFSAGEALRDGDVPTAQLPLVGLGRATATLVCTPYWNDNNYDSPEIIPPFSGGQCPGVRYTFVWDVFEGNTLIFANQTSDLIGPLRIDGTLEPGDAGLCVGNPVGPFSRAVMRGPDGAVSLHSGCGIRSVVKNVFPTFGGPNDCGDPEGELGPGLNPAPSPGPFPSGEDPSIDPDGQPFFFVPPIETPFGDIDVPDDFFGGDGIPGSGDGMPGQDDAIGDEAGEVAAGDGEDVDFGEPPEGRVWVGCIVQTTTDSRIGNISGTGPQQTVWPTVRGNLSLNYGSRKGSNIRINSRFTEAYRPVTSLVVTGAYLQMQPFSSGKVFPISAVKCPENPCGDN